MNKKEKRKHKTKKKKLVVSKEFSKDEADVRALLKARINKEDPLDSDNEVDFFHQIFPEAATEENSEVSNTRESSPNLPEIPTVHLASSYVNIEELSPICPAPGTRISKDASLLFVPSKDQILAKSKYTANSQRDVTQEGLYIEDFKNLLTNNFNRLVNRYLEEEYDGRIEKILNIEKFSRPGNYKSVSNVVFNPVYCPPKPYIEQTSSTIGKCVLIVTIKELRFQIHPQFSEENRLASKLTDCYRIYSDKINQNRIAKLSSELATTRNIVNSLLADPSHCDKNRLASYLKQVKRLRTSLHTEERTLKSATIDCLDTWKTLKKLREKQEIICTNEKLVIKVTDQKDIEAARKEYAKRFEIELNEIVREEFESYVKAKKRRSHDSVPRKPNIEEIRTEFAEIFENDLPSPDEPLLRLDLTQSDLRRVGSDRAQEYYVKIFFDQKLVGHTKRKRLPNDFLINFEETFAVYLESRIPEDIKFEIFERRHIPPDVKISKLFTRIPTADSSETLENLEFSSHKHDISGILKVSLFFEDKARTTLGTSIQETRGVPRIANKLKISPNVLRTWYDNQLINPLDSDCGSMIDAINTENWSDAQRSFPKTDDNENDSDDFTLNEDINTFCSEQDFLQDKRFKILNARYRNELKFKDRRFIPTFDKELEEEAEGPPAIEGIDWIDPIDIDKHRGKKYLKSLYQVVLNHCEKLNRNEDACNLLTGDEIPTFSSIFSSLLGIFGPTRPLNPLKSSPVALQPTNCSNFNIIINIVRATGVPYRNLSSSLSRRNSNTSMAYQAIKPSNVKPYVAVRYKDKILRTVSAEGSNPTWNEQLILQMSRNNLESKDDIIFQLFDEYVEDLLSSDVSRATEVYQRIHTNWLGDLKFPLNTIFSKQQIEGVFELTSPAALIGYTKPSLESNNDAIPIENLPEIKKAVYLTIYINIEPQFEVPITTMTHLECSELKELKAYIQETCIQVKESYPDRFIDPLISLVNGKRICITRLLEPIPLPFEKNDDSETMIRRYVSLFAVYQTANSCLGLHGVWLNNQIILDSSWASPKDLGVLLCCFYLSLEIPAGLVLGIGYPHGETTFVLLKESAEYILVDPSSGRKYSSNDTFCPLVKVFCIISEENVYYNLQMETRVSMTDFNMENQSNWFPLFNRNYNAPSGEIHKLNYCYRELYETGNLQKSIERKIVKKINTWRSNRKTIWNRAFKDTLFNILVELERDAVFDRDENIHLGRITESYPNYTIFGFTQNFTYINLSTIADRIKATGIHLNTDKNIEFSLAVFIQQYPNNILSIWIFIISIIPIRS